MEIAKEALKVPGLLNEIYGDLAKPGVRQAGKALDTVIGLGNTLLWPIAWTNERSRIYLERNLESYRDRLSQIPEEKIIPVPPELGVPIAEKFAYVADETIAELYISLLAKASVSDLASQAHPSFVNVINNLSPDEARFLGVYANTNDLPFLMAKWSDKTNHKYRIAEDLIVSKNTYELLTFPANTPAYVSNLAGLGLVNIRHDMWLPDSPIYNEIEVEWKGKPGLQSTQFPNTELEFQKGVISITHFGKLFFQACHKPTSMPDNGK